MRARFAEQKAAWDAQKASPDGVELADAGWRCTSVQSAPVPMTWWSPPGPDVRTSPNCDLPLAYPIAKAIVMKRRADDAAAQLTLFGEAS